MTDEVFSFSEDHYEVREERFTWELLRARMPRDGRHFWGVGLFFHVENPVEGVSDVSFDEENLAVVGGVYCLWCNADFQHSIQKLTQCPGNSPERDRCGG